MYFSGKCDFWSAMIVHSSVGRCIPLFASAAMSVIIVARCVDGIAKEPVPTKSLPSSVVAFCAGW